MATIFRALGPRTQLNFPVRTAIIYSGDVDYSNIPADSFSVEFSSGGVVTVTLSPPYSDVNDLASDIQSQIDSQAGAGVGQCTQVLDSIFLRDVANQSVEVSGMTNDLFQILPLPNVSVDISTSPITEIPCATNNQDIASFFNIALNTFSNLYEIPAGANELTIWSQVTDNDGEMDGYQQSAFYSVNWTNGTDGYITDGYLSESFRDSIVNTTQYPLDGNDPVQSAIFYPRPVGLNVTTSVKSDGVTTANDVVKIPIPMGATGMYINVLGYGQNSTGGSGKTANPLTISFTITSGTR